MARNPFISLHSVQYISHPDFPWHILRRDFPEKYENPVDPSPDPDAFFHAKIVIDKPKISVFVNDGKWQDKQVISSSWVQEATGKQINAYDATDYGYLWWHGSFKIKGQKIPYVAGFGYGGQALYLVPELDLIFVLTSWGRRQGADTLGKVNAKNVQTGFSSSRFFSFQYSLQPTARKREHANRKKCRWKIRPALRTNSGGIFHAYFYTKRPLRPRNVRQRDHCEFG
ncbi:MAG: hypothetical protein ACE5I1_02255 [bacterium]